MEGKAAKEAARKLAAQWKRQLKLLRAKDVDKKREGLRLAAADARFFREQPEALPALLALLTRLKTPEIVLEALATLEALLITQESSTPEIESQAGQVPEEEEISANGHVATDETPANRRYLIRSTLAEDGDPTAGQPFVALFASATASAEIKTKSIRIFAALLRECGANDVQDGAAPLDTVALASYQTAGSPLPALLTCLTLSDPLLNFEALACVALLVANDPTSRLFNQFAENDGISSVLSFAQHPDRRFHSKILEIVDTVSRKVYGRELLITQGSLEVLELLMKESYESITAAAAVIMASGPTASNITAEDAAIVSTIIPHICEIITRTRFGKCSNDSYTTAAKPSCTDIIDTILSVLQKDISNALNSPPNVNIAPASGGNAVAAAAAATAAANAAAALALFPFDSSRVTKMMSSLGRMIERDDQCRELAYSKHVARFALDAFKISGNAALLQVADKLLHQCCVDKSSSNDSSLENAGVACKPIFKPLSTDDEGIEPVLPVKYVVALLERAHGVGDEKLISRICRWLAFVVEVPDNAHALSDHCPPILLKVMSECKLTNSLLFGFISKCLCAIIAANPSSLTACTAEGIDPTERVVAFLSRSISIRGDENESSEEPGANSEMKRQLLEWEDEYEDETVYNPLPLTRIRHDIDPDVLASKLLLSMIQGFEATNAQEWKFVDFWESFTEQDSASGGQSGKPAPSIGAASTAPSKKHIDSAKTALIGELVVMSLFSSGHHIYRLIPHYAGFSPVVCVNLLLLVAKLLTCRGGLKLLLHVSHTAKLEAGLSRNELEAAISTNESDEISSDSSPSTPVSPQTSLLDPLMSVLHSNVTCFDEVEAAIQVLWILSGGGELDLDTEKIDERVAEADSLINTAAGCGAIVVLIAYLDGVRVPKTPLSKDSGRDRLSEFSSSVEALILRFANWGLRQQGIAERNNDAQQDLHMGTSAELLSEGGKISTHSEMWAKRVLDLRFDVPRFGYLNYSAVLLATETGQTNIALELLCAGACPNTCSAAGTTPLMLALLNRQETLIQALLSHGADFNAITTNDKAQIVWKYALSAAQEANKLISDTYIAAAACSEGLAIDATQLLLSLDFIQGSPTHLNDCLQRGIDVNVSDADGNFLLHSVVSKSRIRQTVRGIDLCFRYDSRRIEKSVLIELVNTLVTTYKSNLDSVNCLGQSALHLSLIYGHMEVARLLLDSGANPNLRDVRGYLPLHYACFGFCESPSDRPNATIELIALLLDAATKHPMVDGCHIDKRKHKTPEEKQAIEIDDLLRKGFLSLVRPTGIVTKLSNQHEVLNTASSKDGFLPWHMACGAHVHSPLTFPLDDTMEAGFHTNGAVRTGILRYFAESWKIDLGKPALKGLTALHLAIKSGSSGCNAEMIDFLLACCTEPEMTASININAVHELAVIDAFASLALGSGVVVSELDQSDDHGYISSRSDANPNQYNVLLANGEHLEAVERHRLKKVEYSGGNAEGLRKYHLYFEAAFSVLHYALQYSNEISLRLLACPGLCKEPEGLDIPLIALACAAHRSADVVKRLIGPHANIRVTLPLISSGLHYHISATRGGMRHKHAAPLHYAVTYEDVAVTRELVESSHVNVNVRRSGDGFTPLHIACELGNLAIIRLLVEQGADIGQEASSSVEDSVTPLRLLIKNDTVSSDAFRALIIENQVAAHHLFGHFADNSSIAAIDEQDGSQPEVSSNEDYRNACLLLDLECQNLYLYGRVHELRNGDLTERESMARKLQSDLAKSDDVLTIAFELIRNVDTTNDPVQKASALETFSRLPHPHECYRTFSVRSTWIGQ